MKTAKRVLAVIVAVIMIVSTCSAAASAAEVLQQAGTSLQATINAAQAGDTVKLTKYTTESVTIDKDLTLDLNGYRLTGDYGSAAIKITKGKVTVTNGQVEALFRKCSTEEMLKTVSNDCPPAIKITGGELILDGVRVVGGQIRVPTTPIDDPILVPAGSGVMSYNGAPVTIKRCSIYGDYGVNNNVRNSTPGGPVTVEDAIILAYNRAVKGDLSSAYYDAYGNPTTFTVAAGSQEIIAADRIAGVLNGGIRLDEDEKELVGNVLNERTMIVVKTPEELIKILNDKENSPLTSDDEGYVDYYTPTITVTPGNPTAEVVAPVLDYTWANTQGTDCSYKMVPYGVKMSDNGSIVDLDKVDASRVDTDCQIVYRVEYKIGDEARDYMDYVISDDPAVNKLDGCLGWAGEFIDEYYQQYANGKNNNGYVDTYDELIDELGDLMWTVDNAGTTDIPGYGQLSTMNEFKTLRAKLYALAGVTAYNASDARKAAEGYVDFDAVTYYNLFGTEMPESGIVGTLDRVDALKKGLESKIGGSFKNTSKWGDLAVWAVDVAYPELIDSDDNILDEVIDKLTDLKNTLNSDPYDKIVDALHLSSQLKLLDEGVANAQKIQKALNDVMKSNDVKSAISYVKQHKDDVKRYVDKVVDVVNNWRTYVTPSKFLAENNTFVKTFSMIGPMELIQEEAAGKLHIIVSGAGTVAFSNGTAFDGETDEEINVEFNDSFTVSAIPEDDTIEFLFWANREDGANRIISTEATFTMNTNVSRDIEAVFNEKSNPTVYFTNPTGDICGNTNRFDNNGNAIISNVRNPYIAAYGFDGWAGSGEGLVYKANLDKDANYAALTDYKAGNSAFANTDVAYGSEGAVLLINPDSSSYIVTPKYSVNGSYTISFYDVGELYTVEGTYSDLITMTSNYEGSAYWVDYQTRQPVFVTKDVRYTVIGNASFESVEGAFDGVATTRTIIQTNDTHVIFNVERSSTKQIATTGVVYIVAPEAGFNPETDLKLDGEGVGKGTAKFTTLDGLYAPSFRLAWLNGRKVYVRPYIEFADGSEPFYGDVVSYN